jgi:hypothetical protein
MNSTETYHDFLRRMDAKVQSVTLHYEDDSVTVSGATLQTCYHDGTWRRNTLIVLRVELVPNALNLFEQFATRKQEHKTHKGNRKTYLSGLDIPFATLVQG